MESSASSLPAGNALGADPASKIRHLPAEAQAAFQRLKTAGDLAALDPLILAILESFVPHKRAASLASPAGDLRLVEDLGFDSLAITEVVFFTEDLLEISIANEEILKVRTLDDLRGFIRAKVAARGAA